MDTTAPALHPKLVEIATLVIDPKNARSHDQANLDAIVASIKKFGQRKPIVVNSRTMHVEAGNGTVEGLLVNGHTHVVAVFVDDDDPTAAAYAIADNRTAELAAWDDGQLKETIEAFPEVDWNGLGWPDDDLKDLNIELPHWETTTISEHERAIGGGPNEDEIPDTPKEPITKLGDVIQLGPHVLHCANCMDVLRGLPDNSVDSIVCDPPYGLSPDGKARTWDDIEALRAEGKGPGGGLMGCSWDAGVPGITWASECLRVLKPGGHLVAFSATRTYHRLAVSVEDAGFEIRDMIGWLQWQGFPKSLDVSKAIDKMKHNRAEVLEVTAWIREAMNAAELKASDLDKPFGFSGMGGHWTSSKSQPTVPTLEQMPLILRTLGVEDPPLRIRDLILELNDQKGEPGPNWWKREVTGHHDTAAAARTWAENYGAPGGDAQPKREIPATEEAAQWDGWGTAIKPAIEPIVLARKPLEGTVAQNVLKWGTGAINIDACQIAEGDKAWPGPQDAGGSRWPANVYHCPKPASGERNAGAEELDEKHPTVKPVGLMRWLLRLVTPPGGTVVEPFGGSGTTLVAARGVDCRVIAAELDPGYCDIIRARVTHSLAQDQA